MDQTSPNRISRLLIAVAAFYLAALLLRAPAILRSVENMKLDACGRTAGLAILRPVAAFTHTLRLDAFCRAAESFERKNLE
jgi:hypothetical protein